ncbi:hypothetical protein K493DRAFT_311915 [Basidiobolus meristosporus CBS 931.73]|uniref:Cyclin N-terminal domain-containing protein n=1 Tax=Basidiobolus meristosporus CBS 931.73 TaxID=1314790 RepID=A0A1Y1YYB3_9FUNG|nr:hypothetical protein K493DRAFT_311915 [Basidiobolus meristosporus CBS 931.73]|eukprot:ORY02874.1 hypothetical protein K493DRAFT_311915 [Basidiobolus meristosporus CBS 931.73]
MRLWYGVEHQRGHMLEVFCDRVLAWCETSPSIIYLAFKYLQRLKQYCPSLSGSAGSEIRILSIALLIAHKYLEDRPFNSRTWSVITGLPAKEIEVMEREFLACIRYQVHVSSGEYHKWKQLIDFHNDQYLQMIPWQYNS